MASETSIIREGKVVIYPGSPEEHVFDPAKLTLQQIRDGLVAVAVQRVFRETTAGKVDSVEDRQKAIARCSARFAGWENGVMEAPRGEAVKLTEEETADAIFSFVLRMKRDRGDARPEKELRKLWSGLSAEDRAKVETTHAKAIKKVLAARLKAKRKPGEDIPI
jgi:hypothetical protein